MACGINGASTLTNTAQQVIQIVQRQRVEVRCMTK